MNEPASPIRVVEVVPILRGIGRETLSYFTKENYPPGSFVRIPLRKKEILGLVLHSLDVRNAKANLKKADFTLRKLVKVERAGSLSEAFVSAARKTALYYASTLGSTLGALLPKFVLESPHLLPEPYTPRDTLSREPLLIQLPDNDRYREYKGIIRERFARGESVIFVAPTHEDALRAEDLLGRGIEQFVFTSSLKTPKKLEEILVRAYAESHPILFITTPTFLFFDRPDLSTIIMERENSRAYRLLKRPFLHPKTFLEYYAKESGKTLIFGDALLSIESLYKEKAGTYIEFTPLTWRTKAAASMKIADLRRKNSLRDLSEGDFKVFSKQIITLISKAQNEKKKILLFGVRKGLSASTVCGHCGSLLSCKNCGAPVVLHKLKDGTLATGDRVYRCHHCGARRDPLTVCDHCGSWKLLPLGVGIDRIVEEVVRYFPEARTFVLDKEHAPTRKAATLIARTFAEEKGGILVGTELALLYLEKIPYTVVVSLDSLFSIPDFGIHERVFYLLNHIHGMTEEEILVQTRNAEEPVLIHALEGNTLDFYRDEIKERQELFYPPFSLFVKVLIEGTPEEGRRRAVELQQLFGTWNPDFMDNRGTTPLTRMLSMIIRVAREPWPDKELVRKLLLLSPEFSIKVDPDSIL